METIAMAHPRRALLAGLAMLVVPAGLGAQDVGGADPDPASSYSVGEALPPLEPGAAVVELTLAEAVDRALERNLDVQSARLDPRIQRYAVRAARAAFDPTVSGTYGFNNSTTPSTSQLDGGQSITTERQTFNVSMSQTLPWYGGRLSADFDNSRTETDNEFAIRNPSYRSVVALSYTQPLLAGRGIDNQRAAVETREIEQGISELGVEGRIANVTALVRQAYWNLRGTIEQIEIQRRRLGQARELLEQNRIKVRLGEMADIEIFQAEAEVASAEQDLLNAEIQWRNQELAFKSLLVGGPDDPLLGATVVPTELPLLEERPVDVAGAVDFALRERTDIRQQRRQLDISEVNLDVFRENALPALDLTASYALQGVGGDLFDRSGLGGEPELVREGGYVDGLESIADFDAPTWNLSLSASWPIGLEGERAERERAELQLRRSELALRNQELAVVTQVTNAGLAVRNSFLQIEAARRSREAAERSLEAELQRFDVGVSTNFEVVQVQDDLTRARLSELQAVIDYVNAIAEFERVQVVGN